MPCNLKETADKWFRLGLIKGDILWFIDEEIRIRSQSCFYFSATYTVVLFCSVEIVCQLALFITEEREIQHILSYGPMFFTSIQVLVGALPLMIQRNTYQGICEEYWRICNVKKAERSALREMQKLFNTCLSLLTVFFILIIVAIFGYIPYNGLNYDENIFPVIKALKLLEGFPRWLPIALIILNYALILPKAYYLAINALHLMHMCVMYAVSNMVLRGMLDSIQHTKRGLTELRLVDHEEYQHMVQLKLRDCVKLDVKIRRFADSQIKYFKWVMMLVVPNAIVLLSLLAYINVFMAGGDSPIGSLCYTLDGNYMALLYGIYSELYLAQVGLNRLILENTPWHTFSLSNRRTMLIFLSNLHKPKYINAGGLVDFNYQVVIIVMRKVFNLLTVFSTLALEYWILSVSVVCDEYAHSKQIRGEKLVISQQVAHTMLKQPSGVPSIGTESGILKIKLSC
ncbi:uncharacterized protein [Euwallacea similis]|uniref:uncharacterized protein n=1 Tax=Euwallacea similis TaxID=1736056 RepID=UPI00344E1231